MATFAKPTFNYLHYSAARPGYPPILYKHILSYLTGPKNHCVDLGTGHGVVARALSPEFTRVTATDPSEGMLTQARELTPAASYPNVTYEYGTGEALPASITPGSVDLFVAAQCAHWFDYPRAWPELGRALRKGGVFALWGYGAIVFPGHLKASRIVRNYIANDGTLGRFWIQPGSTIVEERYRAVVPPTQDWTDVKRIEYIPPKDGLGTEQGEKLLAMPIKVGSIEAFFRSWSSTHRWREAHPEAKSRAEGGEQGDVIDKMLDEIQAEEPDWKDPEFVVDVEWETALVMARKK